MAVMPGFLFALALAAASAPVQGPGLAAAQKLYDSGAYAQAAEAFEALTRTSPGNPAFHYDLGNALYKAGRIGPAIAAYQRAYDLAPRDADIRQNLDFVLKKAGEELVPPGVPPFLFDLFHLLSEPELGGLHWLACWTALLLGGLCLLHPPWRPSLRTPFYAALAFWLTLGAWWGARLALEPKARGVITSASAELRSGPGPNFSVGFTAPEGRRVQILSERAGWLEVGLLKEGAKGWIEAGAVERL